MSLKDDGAVAPLDLLEEISENEVSKTKSKKSKPIHHIERYDLLNAPHIKVLGGEKPGLSGWGTTVGQSLLDEFDGMKHGVYFIVPKDVFPKEANNINFLKDRKHFDMICTKSYKVGSGDVIGRTFGKAFETTEPVGAWLANEDANEDQVGKEYFYIILFAGYTPNQKSEYEELERSVHNYNEQETGSIYVLADGGKTNGLGGTFMKKFDSYRKTCDLNDLHYILKETSIEISSRNLLSILRGESK